MGCLDELGVLEQGQYYYPSFEPVGRELFRETWVEICRKKAKSDGDKG